MFNRLLVFVLVTVVFARPDVSHLKTVESKSGVTSYDVPISSVDKKYVTTTHNRFIQQDLPTVTYVPQVTYSQHYETSGNVLPTLVSNSATGHYGLLGQHGASSEGVHVVTQHGHGTGHQGTHFVTQEGHGTGHQGTHFISQPGFSSGQQGVHFVTQQGHGTGHQGTHFISQQGHGTGNEGAHFVTHQGHGTGQGTHFVTHQGHGTGHQGTHFVTQQGHGTGHQGTHFVTQQGHGTGHQGTHFVTQQGHGTGHQGTHFVTQQGHGTGHQGTHFVTQQGHGTGHQGTHFVTQQGHGGSQHGTNLVTQQGQGGGEKVVITQFGSQPTHGSGQIVGTHHVTHGQIAGIDQHQQHVQNEERVYFFSAPEELHHKTRVRINVVPTHTRKSNVIFVNAPSIPEIIPEVIVPPQQFVEDKTKVVVLVKEHDQFVPISVPAPVPVNKGKTEVFVVKYNDKNDAERILSGTGKFYESSLIQQDKPGFLSTLNANVIKHQAISNVAPSILQSHSDGVSFGTLQHGSHIGKTSIGSNVESSGNVYGLSDGGLGSSNSYGTQFVKVVDTTPKVESYVVKNVESGSGGGSGNIKAVNYEFNTANVVSSTPTVDLYEIKNPGGKQLSTYEVKTVETVKSTPTVVSYGIQNLGGNVQGNTESKTYEYRTVGDSNPSGLNVRYSGDVDGSNQSGYTIQSTEFVHNSPSSEFVSHDNIEGIKRALGKSGGFDIVSISKGTLDGSASLGVNSESLNFGSNVVAQDDNSFVRSVEISESATPSSALLQSKVFGSTQQSQIQKDAAKVVSSSTLSP